MFIDVFNLFSEISKGWFNVWSTYKLGSQVDDIIYFKLLQQQV